MCFTKLILRYSLRPDTSPSLQNERVNAVREEPESQPESYVRDVTDKMQ